MLHLLHDNILAAPKFLGRMRRDMFQHQFADAVRHLIGDEMAAAGQHLEAIGCRDEIDRAFGGGRPTVSSASPQI